MIQTDRLVISHKMYAFDLTSSVLEPGEAW